MINNARCTTRHQWSAAEENSYFTGRGLIAIAIILIIGGYILKAFSIEPPEWVKDALLMLLGGILTAYNTRPEQRSNSLSLTSEGTPPPELPDPNPVSAVAPVPPADPVPPNAPVPPPEPVPPNAPVPPPSQDGSVI